MSRRVLILGGQLSAQHLDGLKPPSSEVHGHKAAGQFRLPLQGSAQETLTENWNGSRWSVVASPNAQNSNNRLHGITVTPNSTLWAVGTTGVFGQPKRTLILRNNP